MTKIRFSMLPNTFFHATFVPDALRHADSYFMDKPFAVRLTVLIFLVSMLANTFGWSFNGSVFTHELAHHHYRELFLTHPDAHLALHHELDGNVELDAATHLCLHAAGQYQPFYLWALQIAVVIIRENVVGAAGRPFPESIPDPFYHPPRLLF